MKRAYVQLAIALILLVAALGGYMYWFFKVQAASADAVSLQQEIDAQSANSAQAVAASHALAQLSGDEATIQARLIQTADVVPFLTSLQSLGTKLGTTVTVSSVSAESTPQPHLALSLAVQGSFDAVMRTLGAIEYEPYDTQVGQVTLNGGGNSHGTSTWSATITLSVGMLSVPNKKTP